MVVTPFPYSDFSELKVRPAFVLAVLQGNDLMVCEITSQAVGNHYAVPIHQTDFATGALRKDSNVRSEKIYTIDRQIVRYKVGSLNPEKVEEVIGKIRGIMEQ